MMDFSRSTVTGGAKTSTIEQRNKETGKKQTFIQEINAAANTKAGSTNTQTGIKRKQRLMVNVERSELISAFSPD